MRVAMDWVSAFSSELEERESLVSEWLPLRKPDASFALAESAEGAEVEADLRVRFDDRKERKEVVEKVLIAAVQRGRMQGRQAQIRETAHSVTCSCFGQSPD